MGCPLPHMLCTGCRCKPHQSCLTTQLKTRMIPQIDNLLKKSSTSNLLKIRYILLRYMVVVIIIAVIIDIIN